MPVRDEEDAESSDLIGYRGLYRLYRCTRSFAWLSGLVSFGYLIIAWILFGVSQGGSPKHVNRYGSKFFQGRLCSYHLDRNPHCMLPYPSMLLLKPSDSSKTGWEFDLHSKLGILLKHGPSWPFKPLHFDEGARVPDGFSPQTSIAFHMPAAVVEEFPSSYFELNQSNPEMKAKTALIDVSTGKPIEHFTYKKGGLIFVQPTSPLNFNTRYVVGIRDMRTETGSLAANNAGMRVAEGTGDFDIATTLTNASLVGAHTIPSLKGIGWNVGEVQLAWDFHTASIESVLLPAIEQREDALKKYSKSGGLKNRIIQIVDEKYKCLTDDVSNQSAYTIHGKFRGPDYTKKATEGVKWEWVEYSIRVSCTAAMMNEPSDDEVTVMHYGHGFLGDRREILGDYLGEMANKHNWILASVDSVGLTRHELIMLFQLCINQAHLAEKLTRSLLQSHINRSILGRLVQDDLGDLRKWLRDPMENAARVKQRYYGNSLGGIMGLGFASLETEVDRAVLGVPGSPYSLVTRFSDQFTFFKFLMGAQVYSDVDIELIVMISQSFWDPIEASGWLKCYDDTGRYACDKVAPQSYFASKRFLIQNGVEDESVTPIGAHLIGAALGAVNLNPVRNVSILDKDGNASSDSRAFLVEWLPERNLHRCLRLQPSAKDQVGLFIDNGFLRTSQTCNASTCVADTKIDPACDVDL